ncbi:MAG: glycosyltransferase family 2 protein [Acidiferrobacterales bacterium]
MPLVDIIMTTKERNGGGEMLARSLKSFDDMTSLERSDARVTIVQDGHNGSVAEVIRQNEYLFDRVILNTNNEGLGPCLNEALQNVASRWDPAPFICYVQDDLLYTKLWLERMVQMFVSLERMHKLAFASGVECIEHQEGRQDLYGGMQLKKYIRAANMFGRRETFEDMLPIPPVDPETGRLRGKPNDGLGSGVDWHFMRIHPRSAEKTSRQCLVIPGLLLHMGYKESTWLKRELPESVADKQAIEERK